MGEFARIVLGALRLGRSPDALLARAAMAEQRGLVLEAQAQRLINTNPAKAQRLFGRAYVWQDRAAVLTARAKTRGAMGC